MSKKLDMIAEIEKLRSMKSAQELLKLDSEIADLRNQINKIQGHRKQSHTPDPNLLTMRAIGSDVLWQAWLDRTQSGLNIDLARAMAQRETLVAAAAKDTSRREAINTARSDAETIRQKDRAKKTQSGLLDLATVVHASGRKPAQ